MEFLNIGGGELIIIVLLAIVLFGPEDILKIMRTIGGYVRKLQQMWTQVSSGLQGEFSDDIIPEDIQETIKETRESVTEVQKTLAEVTAVAKADLNATITAVSEIKASVAADIEDTKATVEEIETSLVDVTSSVEASVGEIPKAIEAITTTSPTPVIPIPKKEEPVLPNLDILDQQMQPSTESVLLDTASSIADDEEAHPADTTTAGEDR